MTTLEVIRMAGDKIAALSPPFEQEMISALLYLRAEIISILGNDPDPWRKLLANQEKEDTAGYYTQAQKAEMDRDFADSTCAYCGEQTCVGEGCRQ